jgi:hypothetical protein
MRGAGAVELLRQRPGDQGPIHPPRTGGDCPMYQSSPWRPAGPTRTSQGCLAADASALAGPRLPQQLQHGPGRWRGLRGLGSRSPSAQPGPPSSRFLTRTARSRWGPDGRAPPALLYCCTGAPLRAAGALAGRPLRRHHARGLARAPPPS